MTSFRLPCFAILLGAAALGAAGTAAAAPYGGGRSHDPSASHAKKDEAKDAKNNYPNATRVEPSKPSLGKAQSKLSKVNDLIADDKNEQADKLLDELLADSSLTPYAKAMASYFKGQIKSQQDDNASAITLLKQAVDLDVMPNANQFPAMYALAQLYLVEEKYPEAVAMLDAYVKQSGEETAKVLAFKANAYYRMEKYQQAVDTMKAAMAKTDKPEESWRQILMASLFELEKFDEAAQIAEADLAKDPNNKKLVQQLSSIYINAKQESKALNLMADAKSRGLFNTEDDYKQLAQLYNYADKPKEGAAALEEGFQKGVVKPSYAMYKLLGDSYALSDQEAKAIEAYGKASPMATDGEADFQRGQLLVNSERYADAKAALTQALSRGVKRQGAAYVLLGNAESELGNKQAAIEAMQKARGYEETRAMADTWLRSLNAGVPVKKAPPQKVQRQK